jgi:hypothetical protein
VLTDPRLAARLHAEAAGGRASGGGLPLVRGVGGCDRSSGCSGSSELRELLWAS